MTKELNALFNSKFNVKSIGAITIIKMNNQIPALIIHHDQLEQVKESIVYISKDDWAKYVYFYTIEHAQIIDNPVNNQKSKDNDDSDRKFRLDQVHSLFETMKLSNMQSPRTIADALVDAAKCNEIDITDILLLVLAKNCENSDELAYSVLELLQHIVNSPAIDDKYKFIQTIYESLGAALTLNSDKFADEVKQKEVQDEIDKSEPKVPEETLGENSFTDTDEIDDEMDDEINDSFNMVDRILLHKDVATNDSISKTDILEMIRINFAMFLTDGDLDLDEYLENSVHKVKLSDDDIDELHNTVDSYTVLDSNVFVEVIGPDAEKKRITPALRDIILSIDSILSELGIIIKNVNKYRITRFEYTVNSADISEEVKVIFII